MNALVELKEAIQDYELPKIKTADINFNNRDSFYLSEIHTTEQRREFWDFLNREYDNDYGYQELYGIVVFIDGSILIREEYDGSEWWNLECIYTLED